MICSVYQFCFLHLYMFEVLAYVYIFDWLESIFEMYES
jgi:hypothetical protein